MAKYIVRQGDTLTALVLRHEVVVLRRVNPKPPPLDPTIAALIERMVRENETWG